MEIKQFIAITYPPLPLPPPPPALLLQPLPLPLPLPLLLLLPWPLLSNVLLEQLNFCRKQKERKQTDHDQSVQPITFKIITSMSCLLEIQSCDIRQRIPFFDSCQLPITWMFNTKLNRASIGLGPRASKCAISHPLTWRGGRTAVVMDGFVRTKTIWMHR